MARLNASFDLSAITSSDDVPFVQVIQPHTTVAGLADDDTVVGRVFADQIRRDLEAVVDFGMDLGRYTARVILAATHSVSLQQAAWDTIPPRFRALRGAAALNPITTGAMLHDLITAGDSGLWATNEAMFALFHPNLDDATLQVLATHPNPGVVAMVAASPRNPGNLEIDPVVDPEEIAEVQELFAATSAAWMGRHALMSTAAAAVTATLTERHGPDHHDVAAQLYRELMATAAEDDDHRDMAVRAVLARYDA